MHDDTDTPLAAFRAYARAFQSLDPAAAAACFHEPALMVSPQGVVALPTRANVQATYARVMADLPARGYARTDFTGLGERRLADDLALVTGAGVWRTAAGDELDRFGLAYTLRRVDRTWRIVVAIIHAPEAPQ